MFGYLAVGVESERAEVGHVDGLLELRVEGVLHGAKDVVVRNVIQLGEASADGGEGGLEVGVGGGEVGEEGRRGRLGGWAAARVGMARAMIGQVARKEAV